MLFSCSFVWSMKCMLFYGIFMLWEYYALAWCVVVWITGFFILDKKLIRTNSSWTWQFWWFFTRPLRFHWRGTKRLLEFLLKTTRKTFKINFYDLPKICINYPCTMNEPIAFCGCWKNFHLKNAKTPNTAILWWKEKNSGENGIY